MKLKILLIGIVLLGSSFICLYAQPTATIISADGTIDADTAICESGQINLRIKFEGSAPFGVVWQHENLETGSIIKLPQLDPIFENNLDNGVWTTSFTFSDTSKITLVEVFDDTSQKPWSINNGSEEVYGEMFVLVNGMPTPEAGSFLPQCGYEAQLNATPSDINNVIYWDDVAGGSFNDKNIANPIFIAEAQGTYTLILTEESGVCKATDDIDVELWGSPESLISGIDSICSNDGINYKLNVTTNISNGTAPYSYKITNSKDTWPRNNVGTIDNFTLPATEETTWRVSDLIDARGCLAPLDSMKGSARVVDKKPNAFAGRDTVGCDKNTLLKAEMDKAGTGLWTGDLSKLTFADPTDPETNVVSNVAGIETLTWTETFNRCSESSTVDIIFVELPVLTITDPTESICSEPGKEKGVATLKTDIVSINPPYILTYKDGVAQDTIDYNGKHILLDLENFGLTTFRLDTITDNKGCFSIVNDSFKASLLETPKAIILEDEISNCGNESELEAVLYGDSNAGLWTILNTDDRFEIENSVSPYTMLFVDADTQNVKDTCKVQWKEINSINTKECVDADTVVVAFNKQPVNVSAKYIEDFKDESLIDTVYLVNELQLFPTGWEEGMTGQWTSDPDVVQFPNAEDGSGKATGIPSGDSFLTWKVSNGVCEESSTLNVLQFPLTTPRGFSPNGDGINDLFVIGGAQHLNNSKLAVFNVNGYLVYDKSDYGVDEDPELEGWDKEVWWDGKGSDGQVVPPGTYYYTFTGVRLKDDGTSEPITKQDYLVIKYSK